MTGYQDRLGDYVDVAERIRIFRERYPNGSLQPLNPEEPFRIVDLGSATYIVYIAAAYRDPDDPRPGVGSAWEPFPGRTPYTKDSELMVAETSAWGRAIVATLAADSKKVASLDEVRARKAAGDTPRRPESDERHPASQGGPRRATDAQRTLLGTMANERGYEITNERWASMSAQDASDLIAHLKTLPKVTKPKKKSPAPAAPETDEEPF
jgi:hypothetical protein